MVRRFRPRRAYRPRRPRATRARTTSVRKIAKKVNRLVRKEASNHEYNTWSLSAATNVTSTPQYVNLMSCSSWARLFGSSSSQEVSQRISTEKVRCRMRFTMHNPAGNYVGSTTINYSLFVCQLKDDANFFSYFDNSTGNITFVSGQTHATSGYRTYLSPKMFKVLKAWHGQLGNAGQNLSTDTAMSSTVGVSKDFYFTLSKPTMVMNANGAWNALNFQRDPSKNLYVILFSDGVYTVTAPQFAYQTLISTKSLGQ